MLRKILHNRRRMRAAFACTLLLVSGMFLTGLAREADKEPGPILHLTVDDAIGPATADYLLRALDKAEQLGASLIVISMDTPGGLDTSMRDIIKAISNSPVPVATWVAPTGARAASAGTYILYASHIAAMAPGTNLGAATPVSLGGGGAPAGDKDRNKDTPTGTDDNDKPPPAPSNEDAMRNKVVNDAVAYIRGLAEIHGRNQDWAERAVREGASLQASEALKLKVIEIIAGSMADLLQQIDGRKVKVQDRTVTLRTAGMTVQDYEMDWRSRLLSVLTNPNVAYILMLIGIYGLIFEFSNPGAIVPGTVGAICLLVALYSLQLLPINYAGMGLILLGVALMVGEAFQPSFGILGIGGIIAFLIGSIILIDTDTPGFGINIGVIATFTASSALVFIFIVGMAIRARRRPVVSGLEQLIGGTATVLQDFDQKGPVTIHSETWQALTHTPVVKGQRVRVTGIEGLILSIEPLPSTNTEASP